MNSRLVLLVVVVLVLLLGRSANATVDLTLYNSAPLLDSNALTPLQGTLVVGDLLQLIWVGPNGLIDLPGTTGHTGGDDALLHLGHVGAGVPGNPDQGFYVATGILLDNSLVGANAFVRFWNAADAASADHYGNSTIFTLPGGDAFGMAELDFAPLVSSPRVADQLFATAVPEPGSLLLTGLLLIGLHKLKRRTRQTGVWSSSFSLLLGVLSQTVSAQIEPPLDVTTSFTIVNSNGTPLPGANPNAAAFGYPVTPGCLIQVIHTGANNLADPPDASGNPTGDDTIFATTVIGQGIAPNIAGSGKFSTSFHPPPAQDAQVYARIWNAPTINAATHWTQSDLFTVQGVNVFDVGILSTRAPAHVNPATTDSDNDGVSDYAEVLAHTDPIVSDITPPTSYTLTVNNGGGDGSFTNGTVLTITVDAPPGGQVFDQWTGATVANAFAASTTLTMPASDTTVTATYKAAPVATMSFTPTNGPAGTIVTITGTDFTGATNVMFNGTSAAFMVDSDTQITAIVPNAAPTGSITVGSVATVEEFVVIPGVEFGAVWVADTANNRIQKSTNGVDWAVLGAGQFRAPEAVAASVDGQTIYVADTKNSRIVRSTDGGATWTNFVDSTFVKSPQGIALAINGDVYVADTKNNRVLRFAGGDATSMTELVGGSQLKTPIGLAITTSNTLYIADTKHSRILQIANADTTNAVSVVTTDTKTAQGVAVDNDGNLYVADTGNSRILFFASGAGAPTLLTTTGAVKKPEGVTVCRFASGPYSADNYLLVSDTGNSRVLGKSDPDLAGSFTTLGGKGAAAGQFNKPGKIR